MVKKLTIKVASKIFSAKHLPGRLDRLQHSQGLDPDAKIALPELQKQHKT